MLPEDNIMAPARLLMGIGLIFLLLAVFLFWERNNPQRLAFAIPDLPAQSQVAGSNFLPSELIIPGINLDLPIIPAKAAKEQWEATTKGVSYLLTSPIPGTKGNSVLYGHNWPNLLGNITKLKPGQVIKIKFADGLVKPFVIVSSVTVSPTDVSILNPSQTSQITLYTCTGFLDNKRFVVVAKLGY